MELFGDTKDYIRSRYFYLRERLSPSKILSAREIPIIINSFNRLTTLKRLISSLEQRGYTNIYILDNCSTYPPLVEWLKEVPYEVIHLPNNLGFKALWKHKPSRKRFCGDYYIYTDADVELDSNCPDDIIERMFSLLRDNYPYAFKIGPSIRIDDLPDCYDRKQEVIEWESRFFTRPEGKELFRAPIDTTFALYRPRIGLSRRPSLEAYRMAAPYQIKHLPWYEDSQNPTEEERYYKEHCRHVTAWSSK
ncbi:MAG: glycosyltransferase [Alistipes sp.]|nr:glycosyltransferase [Alistipes sp.]